MISTLKLGGIIFILFLSFFLNSCVRPEDNGYYPPAKKISSPTNQQKSEPDVYTIEIENMKFNPEKIDVNKGDTVIWINHDMVAHCVTEQINKAWTSSKIAAGDSWKMIVTKSSDYYCAIHQVMKGKIIVE